jgi:hypothetical protein
VPVIFVRCEPRLQNVDRILANFQKIKFNLNSFSGSPDVRCEHVDGQTDMKKIIGAVLDVGNVTKSAKNLGVPEQIKSTLLVPRMPYRKTNFLFFFNFRLA